MKMTALIMAGGRGERFWPRSRKDYPKQFLDLTGTGKTMLQLTVERILPLVSEEDIFVVTNEAYKGLVEENLPKLPRENILCETVGRNTAPCIGLAAIHVHCKYEDAMMIVLPSDHLINDNAVFVDKLQTGCKAAEAGDNLVTIGITPTHPETGYGYIHIDPDSYEGDANRVKEFVEKPDHETAMRYVESKEYLWNSGVFIWKASVILKKIEKHLPETYGHLLAIERVIGKGDYRDVLESEYKQMDPVSIDFGVMEKSGGIYTVPGDFGWDDVGSWLALGRIKEPDHAGNVVTGNVVAADIKNCIVEAEDKLVALVGLEDVIVVDSKDVTLICAKKNAGDIRKIIEKLKESGKEQYL